MDTLLPVRKLAVDVVIRRPHVSVHCKECVDTGVVLVAFVFGLYDPVPIGVESIIVAAVVAPHAPHRKRGGEGTLRTHKSSEKEGRRRLHVGSGGNRPAVEGEKQEEEGERGGGSNPSATGRNFYVP
jgi:hypothetical protein